jgi:predicted glycogen debranching enzyme
MTRPLISFGRETTGDLRSAAAREWLVTNGLGGFASGTVAQLNTRRYHGLLIAALEPPTGRLQLVAGLDETASYAGRSYRLATHQWAGGTTDPHGYVYIESFRMEGTTPVWTYAFADALVEKRVWMQYGENSTYVLYRVLRAAEPIALELKALVNYRDYHSTTRAGQWRMDIADLSHSEPTRNGVRVSAFPGAAPFYLLGGAAQSVPAGEWYNNCFFAAERDRGLDDSEDQLFAARFNQELLPGASLTIVCTTDQSAQLDGWAALKQQEAHEGEILRAWSSAQPTVAQNAPDWLPQLVLAADQFIVRRSLPEIPDGQSIIAGYHWFADWGRDTMISLPGLTLVTGRPEIARKILLAFAEYVDGGMLPNNFRDKRVGSGKDAEYNTIDAALWYFQAVRQYFEQTDDKTTLQKLFPVLAGIVDAHLAGTRYNIHVDCADALVYGGGPGVQLTWMDAKIGDWVVTPRTGKPVEVNALWLNALAAMSEFARVLGRSEQAGRYELLRAKVTESFQKFWNPARKCLYDVIDVPGTGSDDSVRPNQIFAVSLPISPLTAEQQKAVVDLSERHLVTSYGLRSLAPGEPGYAGVYRGGPRERDAAYHQGTVWAWLLGPFVLAHYRVYGDAAGARRFLEPLAGQIHGACLGSLNEIFDADPPFTPGGTIAQAWSVAELLRTWHLLSR